MSDGMNKVMLLGNLGADPELRYLPSGTPVLNLRLATNETYLDKNKEPQKRTEWHSIVVWGSRGEALSRTMTKGVGLLIEGTLRTSSYEKDGQKRYKTEIHAREIHFTSRKPEGAMPLSSPPAGDGAVDPAVQAAVHAAMEAAQGDALDFPPAAAGASGGKAAASSYGRSRVPGELVDELPY